MSRKSLILTTIAASSAPDRLTSKAYPPFCPRSTLIFSGSGDGPEL
ncbi:hypothetical protein [Methanothrix sp.]